jgi:hypothetical protein
MLVAEDTFCVLQTFSVVPSPKVRKYLVTSSEHKYSSDLLTVSMEERLH